MTKKSCENRDHLSRLQKPQRLLDLSNRAHEQGLFPALTKSLPLHDHNFEGF